MSYDFHGAWPGEYRTNFHTPWVNPLQVGGAGRPVRQ